MNSLAQRKEFRNSISEFHRVFEQYDGAITGDEIEKHNPVEHFFADGQYIRKVNFPAQEFIVTKIHKKKHPFFLMKGKLSILSEHGKVSLEAPYFDITLPGTKRIIFTHTACTFITVHATDQTEVDKVEEDVIAKDFNDPQITAHDMKLLMEEK
jgi:hypothetical protein